MQPIRERYVHRELVRFTHTDPAGYVFFPRFFEMFQAAVEDWFTDCLGIPYAARILDTHTGFPTAHLECDFRQPCRLGDVVEFELILEAIGRTSYTLRIAGRVGGQLRLRARVVIVSIDMDAGRPQPLAPDLRERMAEYLRVCQADLQG
ncbi:MAG: acyl-CoA thioesterase [Gammaproteobacteria bacterium]|nr:acyl-CoA thioesterase [Gammaproteobacteria bacterium]